MSGPRIDPDARVDGAAEIGDGSSIWGLAQVREGAIIGSNCTIGRGAYIGAGVRIGDNVKVQNSALIYEPAILENGVFVGPGVILTNDQYPRAVNPDGTLKGVTDWHPVGVEVRQGASLGAGCICVAPVIVGRWALVAAGSVVVRDVADHELVAGAPARRIGWVGHAGRRLVPDGDDLWRCPSTGAVFRETGDGLMPT